MKLAVFGWNSYFDQRWQDLESGPLPAGIVPARIAAQYRHLYTLWSSSGELEGEISGKLRYRCEGTGDFPAVGDWVAVSALAHGHAVIHAVLPSKSKFSRKVAGEKVREQVVAANVDAIFLVMGLDGDFNLRRLERYLALAWNSGADPVVVLNKADICADLGGRTSAVRSIAAGVPVHVLSAKTGAGLGNLGEYLVTGHTGALLGSSGVGKSTIVNALLGSEAQKVQEVRAGDDRGRHTTTHRELIMLPGGGLLIDTPGMRELQLWGTEGDVEASFSDIKKLAASCRFADCRHETEPGCAVKQALEDGTLSPERLQSYRKLQRELAYIVRKEDAGARRQEQLKWKRINQAQRVRNKVKW